VVSLKARIELVLPCRSCIRDREGQLKYRSAFLGGGFRQYPITRTEIRRFVEVYVNCPLEECVRRDVKGLYQKALRGELANFTGVSDPYEPPLNPDVVAHTDRETLEESTGKILKTLERLGYLPAEEIDPVPQEEEARILDKLKTLGYLE